MRTNKYFIITQINNNFTYDFVTLIGISTDTLPNTIVMRILDLVVENYAKKGIITATHGFTVNLLSLIDSAEEKNTL